MKHKAPTKHKVTWGCETLDKRANEFIQNLFVHSSKYSHLCWKLWVKGPRWWRTHCFTNTIQVPCEKKSLTNSKLLLKPCDAITVNKWSEKSGIKRLVSIIIHLSQCSQLYVRFKKKVFSHYSRLTNLFRNLPMCFLVTSSTCTITWSSKEQRPKYRSPVLFEFANYICCSFAALWLNGNLYCYSFYKAFIQLMWYIIHQDSIKIMSWNKLLIDNATLSGHSGKAATQWLPFWLCILHGTPWYFQLNGTAP